MDRRPAIAQPATTPADGVDAAPGAATREPAGGRRIPGRGHHSEAARLERLAWLRAHTGAPLLALQETRLDPARLRGNVENLIGAVEVPVGVAGPLLVRGAHARGWFFAPLATSEGALVSSATRGALALSRSGGVVARVHHQRMHRSPVFVCDGLEEAVLFSEWIGAQLGALQQEVARVSGHARLVEVVPACLGANVFVRFGYATGDAAGQNMTTTATWRACQWAVRASPVPIRDWMIESNASGDKKVTAAALTSGRGLRVSATALVRRDVLRKVLDVTPEQLGRMNRLAMLGSVQAGTLGYAVNVANVVAALFTATGQDIACVHESSLGLLDLEPLDGDLRASLTLPALAIGTVGGGTQLPGQQAALELLGCAGAGSVRRLGELVAAFALALELSTASAVVSGAFAAAHERLGRKRPAAGVRREGLDRAFFQEALRDASGEAGLVVRGIAWEPLRGGAAILSELADERDGRLLGLHRVRVTASGVGGDREIPLVVKAKPRDTELLHVISRMAIACGRRMSAAWSEHARSTQFSGSHLRELGVYGQTDPRFTRHVPRVLRTLRDDPREAWLVVMEDLSDAALLDAVEDTSAWTPERIEAAVRGASALHAVWLGREEELLGQGWLGRVPTAQRMASMTELWSALAEHASNEFPELMDAEALALQRRWIEGIPDWWSELERQPRTLVHNDFNPRNLAIRDDGADRAPHLVAFDWELATLHVPQYDVAELLAHVLTPRATRDELLHFVELHRSALAEAAGRALPRDAWRAGFALALRDYAVNRLAFTFAAGAFRDQPYLGRVFHTTRRLLELTAP